MAFVAPLASEEAKWAKEFFRSQLEEDPANGSCCDSGAADVAWASVSHGIYLSIGAAGVHRSLGVQVSFVRSIGMDAWPRAHLRMMELGGNRRFADFLREQGVPEDMPIREKYQTRAAEWYRENLRAMAEGTTPPTPLAHGTGHLPSANSTAGGAANNEGQAVLDRVFAEAPCGETSNYEMSPHSAAASSPPAGGACRRLCRSLSHLLHCGSRSLVGEDDGMLALDGLVEDDCGEQVWALGVPKLVAAPAECGAEDLAFGQRCSDSGGEGACNTAAATASARRRPPLRPCNEGARRQMGYLARGALRH